MAEFARHTAAPLTRRKQVTLALCITKNVGWTRGLFLVPAQILGGIVSAALVQCMLPGPLAVVVGLSEGTSIAQGVFLEAFGTAILTFVILIHTQKYLSEERDDCFRQIPAHRYQMPRHRSAYNEDRKPGFTRLV